MNVSHSTVGWRGRAPKLTSQRRALKAHCGASCFLSPGGQRGGGFPVCQKLSTSGGVCVVDCGGLEAAFKRARQYGHSHVVAAALRKGKSAGCGWARRHG